jgi:hypothetical protein
MTLSPRRTLALALMLGAGLVGPPCAAYGCLCRAASRLRASASRRPPKSIRSCREQTSTVVLAAESGHAHLFNTVEYTVRAQQHDVVGIVAPQVGIKIASGAQTQVILENLMGRTSRHCSPLHSSPPVG